MGCFGGFGNAQRDALADMACAVVGQRPPWRLARWLAITVDEPLRDRDGFEAGFDRVVAIENQASARQRHGSCLVDRSDLGVGMWRAHERGPERTGCREIVGKAAAARQQAFVLKAVHH